MTTIRRRPQPAATTPWPSEQLKPRMTKTGQVSNHPAGPAAAMWEETLGRLVFSQRLSWGEEIAVQGEIDGLCVALSVLTCLTIEQVHDELAERMCAFPSTP